MLRHTLVAMVYSMLEGAASTDDHGSELPVEGIDVQRRQLLPLITDYNTRAAPG
jgi:hypothetical protein